MLARASIIGYTCVGGIMLGTSLILTMPASLRGDFRDLPSTLWGEFLGPCTSAFLCSKAREGNGVKVLDWVFLLHTENTSVQSSIGTRGAENWRLMFGLT